MNSKRISAALVIVVAIVAMIGLLGTQFNVKGGGQSAPQLEGSWEVTVMPTGGEPFVVNDTFTKGGGIVQVGADPNVSTGIGTWVRTGGNQFAVTIRHFLNNVPLGTFKVRSDTTLDSETDTFSGPFQTEIASDGNVILAFCGTVQGRRLSVEPMGACE